MNCHERGYDLGAHAFVEKYATEKDMQGKCYLDEKSYADAIRFKTFSRAML